MPKPEDLLRIFGILLFSLTTIGFVNRIAKAMLGGKRSGPGPKRIDLVYDSDLEKNESRVCPFLYLADTDPHRIRYERSPCFEKTLIQWYVPWVQHSVWHKFENDNRKRRRKRHEKQATVVEEQPKSDKQDNSTTVREEQEVKRKEKSFRVVYTISGALLVASATFACWEVFKERAKKPNAMEQAKSRGDRKFSLADFTVDRHLRRESRQAEMQQVQSQSSFDLSSKVTQTLIHQGSLDRTISKIGSEAAIRQETLVRRCSFDCDLSGENSPNFRRKSRHFIRKH